MKLGFTVFPIHGIPEIVPGDALTSLIFTALSEENGGPGLRPYDILVVTSKIISKAEGQLLSGQTRDAVIDSETVRLIAERGKTKIVETKHGLIMAAAGVDSSNCPPGMILKLPDNPDESARKLRHELQLIPSQSTNSLIKPIGVIITDTMGRPWRLGLTDNAIGIAGVLPLLDYRGQHDLAGRTLEQTVTAVADEIASAAELVKGKLDGIPVVLVRGLPQYVSEEDGLGARSVVRPSDEDMFAVGSTIAEERGYQRGFEEGKKT